MIITTIGSFADDYLRQAQSASVMGITSQGLFLQLSSKKVIFLTVAQARGPLTINCAGNPDEFAAIHRESKSLIQPNGLFFPEAGLWIDSSQARCWQTPARPVDLSLPDLWVSRVDSVIDLLFSRQSAAKNAGLLPLLVTGTRTETTRQVQPITDFLKNALRDPQSTCLGDHLQHLLGMGEGLTPSGDDFISGFMLALNRWEDVLLPGIDRALLNRQMLQIIYHKTTTLSANLIECSLQGQADERLIAALDGLLTGSPGIDVVVENLAAWGNTSGIDAFTGMAFVIAPR